LAADSLLRVTSPTEAALFLRSRDRPKILYLFQHTDFSGAETFAAQVIAADADPVTVCPPGSRMEQFVRSLGSPTAPLPFRPLRHSGGRTETARSVFRGLRTALDLRRVIRAHRERRILYCTSVRPGMLAALAAVGLRRRHVWVVTDRLPGGLLGFATRLLAVGRCDAALATSKTIAEDFVGTSRRLRRRTRVVYPGVDPGAFRPPQADASAVRGVVVGHISPTKRTDLAIAVARRVVGRHPAFELTVVGEAQYRDEDFEYERALREEVEGDSLLRDRVRFVGRLTNVGAALREHGLLLHARPDEPFGIVLIEAMATGLPVVAPDAAGPREIVVHDETGFLYPPGDVEAAASAVMRLVEAPDIARRMGEAGRARVVEHFSTESQLAGFVAALKDLPA
jgi:glycosyltransferase involved in cell wall biosynthesis